MSRVVVCMFVIALFSHPSCSFDLNCTFWPTVALSSFNLCAISMHSIQNVYIRCFPRWFIWCLLISTNNARIHSFGSTHSIRSCAWIDVKLVEKQTSWNEKRYHCWWCADSGFHCIFRCILECDTLSKSNSRYGIRCLLSNWGSWKWLCAIRNSRRPKEKSKKSKHHERNWPQFQWNRPKKMQTLSQQFSQYNSHCSLNAEV